MPIVKRNGSVGINDLLRSGSPHSQSDASGQPLPISASKFTTINGVIKAGYAMINHLYAIQVLRNLYDADVQQGLHHELLLGHLKYGDGQHT